MRFSEALDLERAIERNHPKLYPVARTIGNGEIVVLLRRYTHLKRKNVMTTFYVLWATKDWYQFMREQEAQHGKK